MEMRNTLALMVQGHEIWLEKGNIEDGNVELALIYGHSMRADGIADLEKITPVVYSPDGATHEPALTSKEEGKEMALVTTDENGIAKVPIA